jgi:hypothetical protein
VLSDAMLAVVEWAADQRGCIGALLSAQSRPPSLEAPTLPYERLAGTTGGHEHEARAREHVRSPGWCLLVPRAAVKRLAARAPEGVSVKDMRAGRLLRVDAESPYAMGDLGALERNLLPVVGTEEALASRELGPEE